MKDFETWKNEIDAEIEKIKISKKRRAFYGLSLEMSDSTSHSLKNYYEGKGLPVIAKKCPRGLWDLIIEIR